MLKKINKIQLSAPWIGHQPIPSQVTYKVNYFDLTFTLCIVTSLFYLKETICAKKQSELLFH